MNTVCIYHKNCFDGTCAAWVVHSYYKSLKIDVDFIPGVYGQPHPDIKPGSRVIIVDFSYPKYEMLSMVHDEGLDLLVLDHHKTAEENCKGLSFCTFDMNESGASLAWMHFYPKDPMPLLVRYIKDRDLWLFKEKFSEGVNAWIQSYPMDFVRYEDLHHLLESSGGFNIAVNSGEAIVRYKDQLVQQIIKNRVMADVAGYNVPIVNSPILMSEVGHALALLEEGPFGAYYFNRSDMMTQWGARSIGDFDVSAVAKTFGGGGHKNAAGWQLPIDNPLR